MFYIHSQLCKREIMRVNNDNTGNYAFTTHTMPQQSIKQEKKASKLYENGKIVSLISGKYLKMTVEQTAL